MTVQDLTFRQSRLTPDDPCNVISTKSCLVKSRPFSGGTRFGRPHAECIRRLGARGCGIKITAWPMGIAIVGIIQYERSNFTLAYVQPEYTPDAHVNHVHLRNSAGG